MQRQILDYQLLSRRRTARSKRVLPLSCSLAVRVHAEMRGGSEAMRVLGDGRKDSDRRGLWQSLQQRTTVTLCALSPRVQLALKGPRSQTCGDCKSKGQ